MGSRVLGLEWSRLVSMYNVGLFIPPITVGNELFWLFLWGISFSVAAGGATGSKEIQRNSQNAEIMS